MGGQHERALHQPDPDSTAQHRGGACAAWGESSSITRRSIASPIFSSRAFLRAGASADLRDFPQFIRAGKAATPVTLKTYLPADLDIAGITLSQYLARLAAEATTVINAAGLRPHHL